jgi:hypothetical protein
MPAVIYDAGTPGFNNGTSNSGGPLTPKGLLNAQYVVQDPRVRDTGGRQKMSVHQNIYDADFEYGTQPLRWEQFTYSTAPTSTAIILQQPGLGGVQMQISTPGDITVRQSRPYHRYQPGKTLYMASNVNFGGPVAGQTQRVGIFDDGNGLFFEQATPTPTNPQGMFVVFRSDSQSPAGGMPVDSRISYEQWNGDPNIKASLDWTKVQMVWLEYSWYGAGCLRWGILINGEPYILHQFGSGNAFNQASGLPQILPWSRTGNLPVRYEQRQGTATTPTVFKHFGVSVLVEGGSDRQRGFTYSYGLPLGAPIATINSGKTRYPLLAVRMKAMGQTAYTQANGAVASGTTTTLVAAAGTFLSGAVTPLTISGNGSVATVTIPNTAAMPAVGSTVAIAGMTTTGFNNATATVLTVGPNTFTYANNTSGPGTVGSGTVTYTANLAGRMLNYQSLIGNASPTSVVIVTTPTVTGTLAANSSTIALTVTAGTIYPGMSISFTGGTFTAGTNYITSQISGTTGGTGVYTLTIPNTGTATTGAPTINPQSFYTVTTAAAHNLTTLDVVTISGMTAGANGIFPVVAVPSGTTFVVNLGYGGLTTAVTVGTGVVTANYTARISSNTATTLTFQDVVTGLALPNPPTATYGYSVGLIDRGQLLPASLFISSTQTCFVELIASTPTAQVGLAGAVFQPESGLGSLYSFAERDVSATAMSGGEVVYAFASPPSGLQQIDLSNFFPILTNIKGNIPDILIVAVTTTASTPISVNMVCQEAMS